MQVSMFSSEELPVSPSVSPDSERDWLIRVATSCLPSVPLLQSIGPSGWFGRTSPEFSPAGEDGTLVPSSGCWGNSGMGSHTGFLTLSTTEWPSDAAVCSLSDTLEAGSVPRRYFLSAQACAGILRRAEKRGKELPAALLAALASVATSHTPNGGRSGIGVGAIIAFSGKDYGADASEDLAPTLRAMPHDGSHANGGGQMAVAIHENQRGELSVNDTVGSLKVGGGKPGQGYPAVAFNWQGGGKQTSLGANTLGANTLGANTTQAVAFQPGNLARGAGSAPSEEAFPTLKSDHGRGASDQQPHVLHAMQVRRLTPRECERLQGFPDDYTLIPHRGKPAADGPRYKALGNSMAVPVMHWIGRRLQMVADVKEAA